MGHHAAPRLAGFDYIGPYRYSVTSCTFKRIRWFEEESIVGATRAILLRTMPDERLAILAYCFMPDHVHLLLEGLSDRSSLRAAMQRWKQASGFEHKRTPRVGLWQTGYCDHVLREDSDLVAAAAYVVGDPLRGQLADSVLDYRYCGSDRFSMEQLAEAIQGGRCRKYGE